MLPQEPTQSLGQCEPDATVHMREAIVHPVCAVKITRVDKGIRMWINPLHLTTPVIVAMKPVFV